MSNYWKNKKVVVTGATGFIGSHAVDTLVGRGVRVTAAISPNTDKKRLRQVLGKSLDTIIVKKANLLNFENCLEVTKGQDVILNFAALDGGSAFKVKYPAQIFKVNNDIVLHMLDAAVKNNVKRILLMSSIEVYPQNVKTPIREQYSLKENFKEEANGYTWSKRFGEIAAKMYAKEYGLEIAIARSGNVYGPGDYFSSEKGRVIPVFIERVLKDETVTLVNGGVQKKQFLFVSDLVDALLNLVERYAVCDPINIAGNEVVTIRNLAELINNIVKDEQNNGVTESKKSERVISTTKAERVIGFVPKISLAEGLKETINYYKKNNKDFKKLI